MKKLFTLLFVVGSIGIASAQKNDHRFDQKDNSNGSGYSQAGHSVIGNDRDNSFAIQKQKAREINAVNREFDQKIAAVKMDRRMKQGQKIKQVKILERQRSFELNKIEEKYSHSSAHKW